MFLVSKNSWSGVNAPPTPGLRKDAMARPRKAPEEKRTARLPGLRLTEAEALFAFITQDKKVTSGKLNFILTKGIGQSYIAKDVPGDEVMAFLKEDCLR